MGLKQCCQTPQGKQHTNLSLLSLHPLFPFSVLAAHILPKCNAEKQKREIHLLAKQLFSERKNPRKVNITMIVIKVYLFPTSLLAL